MALVLKHLRCLKTMGEQKESWDRLIIYIMSNKFDLGTRRDWESNKYCGDLPTMGDLNLFIKNKCEKLEKLETSINREQNIVHSKEIVSLNVNLF